MAESDSGWFPKTRDDWVDAFKDGLAKWEEESKERNTPPPPDPNNPPVDKPPARGKSFGERLLGQ